MRRILTYQNVLSTIGLLFTGWLLYYSVTLFDTRQRFGIVFVAVCIAFPAFTSVVQRRPIYKFIKGKANIVIAILFIGVASFSAFHFWTDYYEIIWDRAGAYTTLDFILGGICTYLVIHFLWRAAGPPIPIVIIVFLLYTLLGKNLPGFFSHGGASITKIIEISAVDLDGIFGLITQIGATWVAVFVLLASFIAGFGGIELIVNASRFIFRKFWWGLPQVAVFGSMGLGCFSGNAAANAAGTGAFTIPLMKRYGIPPTFAGAVEAISSSGGQIMPPILGAAAFLMAEFLGKHYLDIVAMSLAPALLYYLTVSFGVYLVSSKYMPRDTSATLAGQHSESFGKRDVVRGLPILASLTAVVVLLAVIRMGILTSGFCGIVTFFCCQFVYEMAAADRRREALNAFLRGVVEGARTGTATLAELGLVMAGLGIIIATLTHTGLSSKIAFYAVMYFGEHLILLMIFTMIICILFGMAVSTVAVYVLTVMFAAPALLKVGLPLEASHFAVFYWAILSAITPPVAGIVVVTSKIAGASFFRTCLESMKLGFALLLLPFIFFQYPAILTAGPETVPIFFRCVIGFLGITYSFQAQVGGLSGYLKRFLCFAMGFGGIFLPLGSLGWLLLGGLVIMLFFDLGFARRLRTFIAQET